MRRRSVVVTLLVSLCLIVSLMGWTPAANAAGFSQEQKILLQSWRLVNQAYIDDSFNQQNWWQIRQDFLKRPLKTREDTYKAIDEMLATLDEPFTRLLRPQQYHNLQMSTAGELSGVGLQININPDTGKLEVVAPLVGSPAEDAGIAPRDRILFIDGVDTATLTLDEAAAKMRGPKGTKVSLTILPNGQQESQQRTVDLIRDRISLSSVYASLDQHGSIPIGYIRLTQFSANAAKEVSQAIKELEKQGAQAYIFDLRNNPGGLLQAGIEIARLWLDKGTIVYTVNRQGAFDSFAASGMSLTEDPLIVLVNEGTASASEILAGALQDNGRALLLGEKTFGKGLIQSLFELPDGAGLAITVAKYETPAHKDIHKAGIVPDQLIHEDPITYQQIGTEKDLQYQEALKLLTDNPVLADAG
ncbi:carboxyl-terminal processing protease CtpA [Gloeothece verrucosa]|uniref:Carboxyl-terminal-processing protease n=1 Tax=Gloeothece verrucosa (strain PCC 7822) TaxID=497965 RepID=E0UIJ0_GLOV7|nr:carboxyl-terminal processing protease CtpA [Gloeothece verrucosa]ADN12184.1 carboxyl-terminal protease [Gloeothece verrucosa PCC 7822]